MKKIALFTVAVLALGAVVVPVSASALTAQEIIDALTADPTLFAALQAALGGGVTTGGAASGTSLAAVQAINTDLTIGSKGADVTTLQTWLVEEGYLVMPVGVPMGYFGTLTQKALAQFQAENAITPAAGYFGPKTRGVIATLVSVPIVPSTGLPEGCASTSGFSATTGQPCTSTTLPAGCTSTAGFSPTTGQSCGGAATVPTGITTPGVEGTLAATQSSSGINSTVYEGDTMKPILGVQLEAKNSDIMVQRVKIDLGTTTKIYNKIYSKLYVTEGSDTLAEVDLNSSTVIKDSGRYYITIAGFNLLVPKGSKKVLVIKADVRGSIDTNDRGAGDSTLSWGIRLATDAVRGIDGAGVNQYAGTTAIGKSITVSAELAETATLDLSINSASPLATDIVAADGAASDELDRATLLVFDLRAKKDNVTVTDVVTQVTKGLTGTATASTTAYLYEGSGDTATEIDNATVGSNGVATFADIDKVIAKDTTKTYSIRVDIRNAGAASSSLSATTSSSGVTAENSQGSSVTVSGSASGNTQYVRNIGPIFTLVSKTITTDGVPQVSASANQSTSTLQAKFVVRMTAVGGDIMFGTAASGTALFANNAAAAANGTHSFVLYFNSTASSSLTNGLSATTTDYAVSSGGGLVDNGTNTFTLNDGSSVDIEVTHSFQGRLGNPPPTPLASGQYSVGLEYINWVNAGIKASNSMAGKTEWRTSSKSFP